MAEGTPAPIELSVILPAYDEGSSVRDAVERYVAVLGTLEIQYEIIVVDDGSSDDTLAVAHEVARRHETVRVLANSTNQGQVRSILSGMAEARGAVVTHNGVDLPFDPSETNRLLDVISRGADVVVVERTGREAYTAARKLISWCNILLVKFLFRTPFSDHNFVQAFRRHVLEAIRVESRGVSTVTTELILKSIVQGFDVRSIRADYHTRIQGSSTITLRKIARTIGELGRLWVIMHKRDSLKVASQRPKHAEEVR